MSKFGKQYEFAAPIVPLADPADGLLPATALEEPLPVNIVIWDTLLTGDSVRLMVNGKLCGEIRTKTEDEKPGDIIAMHLDEKHLTNEGVYTLGFRATNPENGTYEDSPTILLLVDRTPPGATLLAPVMFAHVNCGETLLGTLPGYAGMEPGDLIQTRCNGTPGPTMVVDSVHLTEQPILITFDRAYLEGLNSETIRISYDITDRAGNRSIESQAVVLTYQG